jgi:hypothetical protein
MGSGGCEGARAKRRAKRAAFAMRAGAEIGTGIIAA